jgi:hypothetical protein
VVDACNARIEERNPTARSFEQLRAKPWALRAGNELRATGAHRDRHGPQQPLTPQQHQIASLAAAGLTNQHIGERLFLPARTVGLPPAPDLPQARRHLQGGPARRTGRPATGPVI